MKPPHRHTRINLDDLKAQIVKKLGPDWSKQYFYYLHRFLSLKLSKVEFSKLCLRILGQENIPLHNQLIRSILGNACSAKATAPSANHHKDDYLKEITHVGCSKEIQADGHRQNGSHISIPQASLGLSNGSDMLLPVSPRKARTGLRDRRGGDRRSALGANGKMGLTQSSDVKVVSENRDLKWNPPDNTDFGRPLQHHQVVLIQPAESESVDPTLSKTDNVSLQKDISARSLIRAPLGVPLCPASLGGPQGAALSKDTLVGPFCDGALLDSHALRERMEGIAVGEALEGVSDDCASVLNHGLNSYMKGLIKSCIDIVRARSGYKLTKNNAQINLSPIKHHSHMKLINGVKLGHQYQLQNSGVHLGMHEQKIDSRISLQDFRVAMEVNPRQLGEDWPLLLEKICTHAFEE